MSKVIGSYIHSDAITANKGAALVVVEGDPGFGRLAARMAYGAEATSWEEVMAVFPEADLQRQETGSEVGAMALLRLSSGEVGRVEVALAESRAAAIKVTSMTDFGAKTDEFRTFCREVVAAVLLHGVGSWSELVAVDADIESRRMALAKELREKIEVVQVEVAG